MNDELLSRMAETLFWTGRYVERADDTARLVDVYVHRLLSDPAPAKSGDSGPLFGILGVDPGPDAVPDVGAALFRLAYDPKSPSAIAGAVLAGPRPAAAGPRVPKAAFPLLARPAPMTAKNVGRQSGPDQ